MKNVACALLLSLCSATMACKGRDPLASELGRFVEPRLSDAYWRPCCDEPQTSASCDEPVENRGQALQLLVRAEGVACLDRALAVVQRHAKEDLAAAHFIRAKRLDEPVEYLRALRAAEGSSPGVRFNRALAQEALGLTKEAIKSWDDLLKIERSDWSKEARHHRDRLLARRDPAAQAPHEALENALRRRDRSKLGEIANAFPSAAAEHFETSNILDLETSRLFADVLFSTGDSYAQAVVNAAERTRDRKSLAAGLRAFRDAWSSDRKLSQADAAKAYARAAELLERAGNPLYLAALYRSAASRFIIGEDSLPLLDAIAPVAAQRHYQRLSTRIQTLRATALEYQGDYVGALRAYDLALHAAKGDASATIRALTGRSANYATMGDPERAFGEAFHALRLLERAGDLNSWHHAYGAAAEATQRLDHPHIALQYQNAAVEAIEKAIVRVPSAALKKATLHYAVALRVRANLHVELGLDENAEADLRQAADLAAAIDEQELRGGLNMRVEEVRGQALLKRNPTAAAERFSRAITLATEQHSTYRAVLHFKRAAARRNAGDARADEDIGTALAILRAEAAKLLDPAARGRYEELWTPYFSRFQAVYRDIIQASIDRGDVAAAFLYAEQARAFEPMQLILQSHEVPPGFRKLETKEHLLEQLRRLDDDTVVLQYLVTADRTYTWVVTRGGIELVRQRAGKEDIERWVNDVNIAVRSRQRDPFTRAMRAVHAQLFKTPLDAAPGARRIVIVPDGPMHALPFAGLQGTKSDGYLIERGSIAVAGSTSLYLYALARDARFSAAPPHALIVGDPALDPGIELLPLPYSREEALRLGSDYPGAEVLTGDDATIARFLAGAKKADIIHFAGHGVPNAQSPWNSMLLLARSSNDSGQLTAGRLMTSLSELERTRLVVLGACSSAGGSPIGPEGVAPLVRPLIAANVPAVVGTLWDVRDATAKDLLVSFHCHYRNGDDVAVALRHAQLEMLRNNEPATSWAQFQVVGHAASPYARGGASEESHSGHVCTENSLHRPDGIRSQ